MRNSFHLALNNVSSYALFSSSTLYTGSFHFLSQTNEGGLVQMVNLTQAIKSTNHWMLVGNYLFYYRPYFLDLRLERVLRITLRSERFSRGVHNNWSYHCLYFQTPGQLEDFFKLESCLLDISTKINSSTRKIHLLRYSYSKFKIWKQRFVHCSSRYQAVHLITIILYLLLKFILGNSYFPLNLLQRLVLGISQQSMLKASVLPNQE